MEAERPTENTQAPFGMQNMQKTHTRLPHTQTGTLWLLKEGIFNEFVKIKTYRAKGSKQFQPADQQPECEWHEANQ